MECLFVEYEEKKREQNRKMNIRLNNVISFAFLFQKFKINEASLILR